MDNLLKADAVFEGGGVKGIGLVGAISVIEKKGYFFENLAGTSAGAIVAALLAAGYKSDELKQELNKLDYNHFKDKGLLDKIGGIGKTLSIGFEYGIYEGNFFEEWMEGLLKKKGITEFGQLTTGSSDEKYKYKLQVIAADITDHKLLVLPRDLKQFVPEPDKFSISKAVRMSMSIPLFFEPVKLLDLKGRTHVIVDGGVLSNYPIWLLDDGSESPAWPTFGFKLIEPNNRSLKGPHTNEISNFSDYLKAIIGTMLEAHDNYHISISKGDYDRTIGIPTVIEKDGKRKTIRTTDFDISPEESEALYYNGVKSASDFLMTWDFEAWKKKFRNRDLLTYGLHLVL